MSSVFYYYGGKKRLAHLYPAPEYRHIIEPFAGGAGYAMHHLGAVDAVTLIERDARVAALWRRLLREDPEHLRSIGIPDVGEWTTDFLTMTASASNAIAACKGMTVQPRMLSALRTQLREIIAVAPVAREKVVIAEGDYHRAWDVEATWFIDPPYEARDGIRGAGYNGGRKIDYEELASWCRSRRGQVIVCEQEGAEWLPFQPLGTLRTSQGRTTREVVWSNRPLDVQLELGS